MKDEELTLKKVTEAMTDTATFVVLTLTDEDDEGNRTSGASVCGSVGEVINLIASTASWFPGEALKELGAFFTDFGTNGPKGLDVSRYPHLANGAAAAIANSDIEGETTNEN